MLEFNNFFKTDDAPNDRITITNGSKRCQSSKNKINKICKSIAYPPQKYKPSITVDSISTYVNNDRFLGRILYSQISSYIYGLDDITFENYITNVDRLLEYALDENITIEENIRKIVVKIYDHSNLAKQQKLQFSNEELFNISEKQNELQQTYDEMKDQISDTEESYYDTIKSTQREYIAIFGIFSAIIIAFVGGISFSSSIMESISSASRYRISFIASLSTFFIFNTISYLVDFLFKITNGKNGKKKDNSKTITFWIVNIVLVLIMIGSATIFFLDRCGVIFANGK